MTLADVFKQEGEWEEARFDIADRSAVTGIGVRLGYCGEDGAASLELRLAHRFTRLTFKVGQANDSPSSDGVAIVEIEGNGKQLDSRRVRFDFIQSFDLSVKDVNALKLRIFLAPEKCEQDGTKVIIEGLTVA